VNIRRFQKGDQQKIAQIHAEMGLDYQMPDLKAKMVKARSVAEHNGEVIGAIAAKIEPEIYLWLKPGIHPAMKWDAIRLLQRDLVKQAVKLGFEQLVCYVPDCVGRFFGKRMKMLRWEKARDGWKPWVLELRAKP
jgi:hypothetical protein